MKNLLAFIPFLAFLQVLPAYAGQHPQHPMHKGTPPPPKAAASQIGTASWYGRSHAGRLTANGERFNPRAMTCAHRTLPLGSVVAVTNVATGTQVTCRINDRGPYIKGRILDLSERAATRLGVGDKGLMRVRIDLVSRSSSDAES
ncbi:septal ring lytic transglycosylase RlpA family protein [Rhodovastum atsumiense]|uniref:septal ring lytic transglycosylase RlpA family protein n=1 Tax=Rhodovastum atsumiense TaxID=504468 RepID=UPI00193C14F0|nr:septal ring lytic transglycosylase RlpA family protein [Rhodovastum atsumiense]